MLPRGGATFRCGADRGGGPALLALACELFEPLRRFMRGVATPLGTDWPREIPGRSCGFPGESRPPLLRPGSRKVGTDFVPRAGGGWLLSGDAASGTRLAATFSGVTRRWTRLPCSRSGHRFRSVSLLRDSNEVDGRRASGRSTVLAGLVAEGGIEAASLPRRNGERSDRFGVVWDDDGESFVERVRSLPRSCPSTTDRGNSGRPRMSGDCRSRPFSSGSLNRATARASWDRSAAGLPSRRDSKSARPR